MSTPEELSTIRVLVDVRQPRSNVLSPLQPTDHQFIGSYRLTEVDFSHMINHRAYAKEMSKVTDILVVMAHADDAAIFVGGSIRKMATLGHSCHVCSLTGPHDANQERQMREAGDILGYSYDFLGLVSANDPIPSPIVLKIRDVILGHLPKTIVTHWQHDTNPGHGQVHDAVLIAAARASLQTDGDSPRNLRACDTYYSWGKHQTPFPPSYFVDVSEYWDQKIEAVRRFTDPWTAKQPTLWTDMSTAMGRLNGGRCGVEFAEAFAKLSTLTSLRGGEAAIHELI